MRNLRDLRELFGDGFGWLTSEPPGWGGPHLYQGLAAVMKFPLARHHVNCGVLGTVYGAPWVPLWAEMSLRIATTPELARVAVLCDQSAVVALLNGVGPSGLVMPTILTDRRLNWAVSDSRVAGSANRKAYDTTDPERFLAEARADHPAAWVVHWLGKPKPWQELEPATRVTRRGVVRPARPTLTEVQQKKRH